MANGVEEFNEASAWSRLSAGFKMPVNQEANKAPELRFVEGFGPNGRSIQNSGPVTQMPILDSWVTRYPNAKLGK